MQRERAIQGKFTKHDILDVISEFWDVDVGDDAARTPYELIVPATPERPAIYFDARQNALTLVFPNDNEELPTPYAVKFYPQELVDGDYETMKRWAEEEFGKELFEKIARECGDEECIRARLSATYSKRLERQLYEEIDAIEKNDSDTLTIDGARIIYRPTVYEAIRSDGVVEYTAYLVSDQFTIDLNTIRGPDHLKKVIEKVMYYSFF